MSLRPKALKLDGMAEAFAELQTQDGAAALGHAEWLGLLIDRETASRDTKRFESRIRTAKLCHGGAVPEDVDYKARRGLVIENFEPAITLGHIITSVRHRANYEPRP